MHDDFDRLIAQIAESHHGVFASHHLRQLQVPDHVRQHRLTTGRWALVHERVYRVVGNPLNWHGHLLAACWAGGTRAVASHRSAAALWNVPGGATAFVEITCPRWRRAQHRGIVVHESTALDPIDVTERDGVPVTTVARTLFDLAAVVGPTTLDLALENALRRDLTAIDELTALLQRLARKGRRGTTRFRAALEAHRGGDEMTESEAERHVVVLLRRQGLPAPAAQHEIRDRNGRFVARVDFAYPELKIAIEYDSCAHHTGRAALVRDSARRNAVVALGWLPITVTAQDLRNGAHRLAEDLRRARSLRSGVKVREQFEDFDASSG